MNKTLIVLSALVVVLAAVAIKPVMRDNNPLMCPVCTEFVKDIDQEVINDEQDVENVANNYCDKKYQGKKLEDLVCRSVLDTLIKDEMDALVAKESPEHVCKKWC